MANYRTGRASRWALLPSGHRGQRAWRRDPEVRARLLVHEALWLGQLERMHAEFERMGAAPTVAGLCALGRLDAVAPLLGAVNAALRASGLHPISRRTLYRDRDRIVALSVAAYRRQVAAARDLAELEQAPPRSVSTHTGASRARRPRTVHRGRHRAAPEPTTPPVRREVGPLHADA